MRCQAVCGAALIGSKPNCLCLRRTSTVCLARVPLLDMWTHGRWGPESTLPPAAHAKAMQLGQKLSIGLEVAYQASARHIPNAVWIVLPLSRQYSIVSCWELVLFGRHLVIRQLVSFVACMQARYVYTGNPSTYSRYLRARRAQKAAKEGRKVTCAAASDQKRGRDLKTVYSETVFSRGNWKGLSGIEKRERWPR